MRKVISELAQRGYKITYYNRKDGGVRINRIDNMTFKGSEGNVYARNLAGVSLSERREKQLHSKQLATPKGQWSHKRKAPLDKKIVSKLRRVQRLWRKKGIKAEGYPSMKNIRYAIKEYGEAEALKRLEQNERYALGIAYDENIQALIDRLEQDKINSEDEEISWINKTIELIKKNSINLKDETLMKIYEVVYNFEKGTTLAEDFYNLVSQLLA